MVVHPAAVVPGSVVIKCAVCQRGAVVVVVVHPAAAFSLAVLYFKCAVVSVGGCFGS